MHPRSSILESSAEEQAVEVAEKALSGSAPRPPYFFADNPLPFGHPCQEFTLPPPPADKKRTGPRRKWTSTFSLMTSLMLSVSG